MRFCTSVVCWALVATLGCASSSDSVGPITTGPTTITKAPGIPEGWSGSAGTQTEVGLTPTERHGGASAIYFSGPATNVPIAQSTPATLLQSIRATNYRGKRVRFSAWVKPLGVADASYAGLWMRVDGPGLLLAFDNMMDRPVIGSGDWRQISIVLDVPQNALGIALGMLFNAHSTLLMDDMRLEVVGAEVATTSPNVSQPSGIDSATIATTYARLADAPANLDFEGLPGAAQQTIDWLSRTAIPLAATDPKAPLDDLEPLRQIVGSAHLVGLGEGTHGTREFFQMKHRILQFLVTKMGFTHFAIEATSPESDDMNRYVLTGQGDPARLLSRLYFWTWNTQEVADMIAWMREWNRTAPENQRVQFLGFDMQSPGASIDSVISYVGQVDQASKPLVVSRYACLNPYRNFAQTAGQRPFTEYAALPASERAACAGGLLEVFDMIKGKRSAYETASSPSIYQSMLHHARLVQQFETMASGGNSLSSGRARDAAMAENIAWIREQAGPSAKIALWAHNGHINSVPGLMGGHLRMALGSDYLTLGFAFGRGTFTAVGQSGSTFTGLGTWSATTIPKSSIEAVFDATAKPRLLLDARLIASGGAAAAPLAGPIAMRSIGAGFSQQSEAAYFYTQRFPDDFDLLIYLSMASASVRLPFVY